MKMATRTRMPYRPPTRLRDVESRNSAKREKCREVLYIVLGAIAIVAICTWADKAFADCGGYKTRCTACQIEGNAL